MRKETQSSAPGFQLDPFRDCALDTAPGAVDCALIGDSMAGKICIKCGEAKALGEFNCQVGHGDGRTSYCKKCARMASRKWRQENRERAKANSKKWAKENPERHNANGKRWAKKNPKKIAAHSKRWAEANPEKRKDSLLRNTYGITLYEYDKCRDDVGILQAAMNYLRRARAVHG